MQFPSPLQPGTLVKRYKRFLADIELDSGEAITAHCANPGSMMGVAPAGARVWVSTSANKARKLPYSWELVEVDDTLVAINTGNPNKIAADAIANGAIPELAGYETLRREVKYGQNSRIDIYLDDPKGGGAHGRKAPCYVEVKNVHLMRSSGLAEFPDSVTTRGAKHLGELSAMAAEGARAVMLYIVQRGDCRRLRPAADLDPGYAAALEKAVAAGVETLCYDCEITTSEIVLRRALSVELA
ncbi:MAG: DNA/RNA nuclease SfsA [Pseudomonadota bacterium]